MKNNKIYAPIIIALSICIGLVMGSFIFGNPKFNVGSQNNSRHKLNRLIDVVENNFVDSINTDSIVDLAVTNILDQLDPHSFYIPFSDKKLIDESMNGQFVGIGVTYYMLNDTLAVINAIEGGPSIKAGIKSGDRILYANNRKLYGEKISTDTLMNILKGEIDSDISLKVFRKSENKTLNFTFKRNIVPVKSVDVAVMLNKTTGYIKVNRFAATTYKEFKKALDDLKKQNASEFILDFRNNGGGYVEIADQMIEEFLPKGQVMVRLISKAGTEDRIKSKRKGEYLKEKVYVIIDENSASASEIFAGAIQDNDRGVIIGRRSFGKGLVQQDMSLGDGSSIRLTVSKYHTPSGRSIQKPYALGDKEYKNDFHNRITSRELYIKDSIKIIDSVSYKTLAGRKIYESNGGIVPDVFIPLPKNHIETELKFVMQSAFVTNFIFQIIDENRNQYKVESYDDIVNYLENTDTYYKKVKDYLKEYPLSFDPDKYKPLIKRYITAEFINQLFSETAYYKYLMPNEPEIQKVFEIQTNNQYSLILKP